MPVKIFASVLIATLVLTVSPTSAHSGRTDANGGHNCYVGACAGTYHYHNGGGSSTPAPTYTPPAPRVPVRTTRTLTQDAPVNFKTKTEYTNKEYKGYVKVLKEGINGLNRISTVVNLSDGAEVSRNAPTTVLVTAPVDKVIVKGTRTEPEAKLTAVKRTAKADRYNFFGQYKPNSEVVLELDGKKIKRAKTDNKGKFQFEEIKIKVKKATLAIHKRVNKKEKQVSEKTYADLSKLTLQTEYERLHSKD